MMSSSKRRPHRAATPVRTSTRQAPPQSLRGQFRQFEISVAPQAPPRWPSVSACLIVKNEAANLRACLESLGDLASEVVVVDTGSHDDTVEIARALGATVHHFSWINDFAAARNESLRHAGGDWVFWLDADDRLSPTTVAQLKRACASGMADAYRCMVLSKEPDGRQTVTEHVRLFRNGLGIRFTGSIHEAVWTDLVRLGLRLAVTDIAVEHTGYTSQENIRQKSARNLAIVERELALDPTRTDLLFYRGHARASIAEREGAEADMREYLSRTRPSAAFDHMRFWAYSVLARIRQEANDRPEAEAILESALSEFPSHPHFLHLLGCLHLLQGRLEEASRELRAVLEQSRGAVLGFRPPDWWAEGKLAECSRAQGKKEDAIRWAERARAHARASNEIGLLLARLYVESGRAADAEATASALTSSGIGPEPWLILAELCNQQGRWEEADLAIRNAQRRGLPESRAEELLARMKAARVLVGTRTQTDGSRQHTSIQMQGLSLLARGEPLKAAECFAEAVETTPSNPDNYRYLAVALHSLGRENEALDAWRLAARCGT